MPAHEDFEVWKGNTFSLPIEYQTRVGEAWVPVDFTGSDLVFRCVWDGGSIRKSTADSDGFVFVDATAGTARLLLTVQETRNIPTGKQKYEIEHQSGSEQTTILYGELIVSAWVNDD